MNYKKYILSVLFLSWALMLTAQIKKEKSSKNESPQELLKYAQGIHEKDPQYAIKIIDNILNPKTKRSKYSKSVSKLDLKLESDAYTLLGDIYRNIDQSELAIARYEQALGLLSKTKYVNEVAALQFNIGRMRLKLEEADKAEAAFFLCIQLKTGRYTKLCQEGLADVEYLRGNTDKSISQIDMVQSSVPKLDSLTNSRLEAKRSQNYSKNEDYFRANKALKNSVDNLPKSKAISKKDYEEISKAADGAQGIEGVSNEEKIEVSNNVLSASKLVEPLAELAVLENLQVASVYEDDNNLYEADRYIRRSKAAIDKNTSATSSARVFKKSAEINQKLGSVDAALEDIDRYVDAKERSILDLENQLKVSIDIVKGQKGIDLGKKDVYLAEKDKQLLESQVTTQKWIIGLLSLILGASAVFFYFLNKSVKDKRRANQLLLLKSLRTQMNPHFIFNALNSVNNFISKNEEKAANKFLADFSRLMRSVLDYSQKDLISFEEEVELNELYLKLEHFRFRDKFEYDFKMNIESNLYDLKIPPMLIQPFIENAVWHGLRYKDSKGYLSVSVNQHDDHLSILIKDDGIGRQRSKVLKTSNQKKYKSTGLENVSRRLELINEVYQKNYTITVSDANSGVEDVGTLVKIKLPL